MIDSKPAGRAQLLFGQLSKIAKATTFIMRKRKVTAEGFLLCFLKSVFNGKASFQQMASRIGRIDEISITKQGLWKKVDHTAIAFLLTTLTIDLLTGKAVDQSIHCATAQDKTLGKDLVDLVKEKDLFLRDMGYFILAEFTLIEKKLASWLSRIPANVFINTPEGQAIEKILRKSQAQTIDMQASLGKEEAKPARLVAMHDWDGSCHIRGRRR